MSGFKKETMVEWTTTKRSGLSIARNIANILLKGVSHWELAWFLVV